MGNDNAQSADGPDRFRWQLLVVSVLLLGLALRVLNAWSMQYSTNPDFGITALMVKHMAEGRDFPVFFYGQSYMGSLEPAISALLCRLFGVSGFMITLGTALVGFLTLPLIYLWARDAGGRQAGLAALLFCLVGSDTIFHYGVAPRGGYMTLMACGLLTLWLSIRITIRCARDERVPSWLFLVLGLVAGLGWWSNQLIVVFYIGSAAVFLLGFRRSLMKGILPAGLAFLVGSSPWWLWNLTHQWATLDFAHSLGRVHYWLGIQSFIKQSLNLVELTPWKHGWDAPRLLLMLLLMGLFIVRFIYEKRRGLELDRFLPRAAAVAVALGMAAIYVTSKYATISVTRYLLPLYPAVAVMLGVSVAELLRRYRFPFGWIALAVLIPSNIYLLPKMPEAMREGRFSWAAAQKMADVIAPLCDGVCISGFNRYWVNIATSEKLCVSSQPKEPYAPYGRRVELADNPAVLDDFNGIMKFLALTESSGQVEDVRYAMVIHHLTPPRNNWNYVDSSAMVEVRDVKGEDYHIALSDSSMNTAWRADGTNEVQLTLALDHAHDLNGIRLLSPNERYPFQLALDGFSVEDQRWRRLITVDDAANFFWSGPRLLVGGVQYFQEYRFAAPTGGVNQLRLTMRASPKTPQISLAEIRLLETVLESHEKFPSVQDCVEVLRPYQITALHAPRWLASRLSQVLSDVRITPLPSVLSQSIWDWTRRDPSTPQPITFNGRTGLILEERDAPRTRALLQTLQLNWREEPLKRYRLLVIELPRTDPVSQLCWTELGCFAAHGSE
jgi:hypothetical protein